MTQVPDAGCGMLHPKLHKWGSEFEVYPCPDHRGSGCSMCGGGGFRAVCNDTNCHEHGCDTGGCARTADDFRRQAKLNGGQS
jgi:hypothetical protein